MELRAALEHYASSTDGLETVVRRLIEHDEWYVPVGFAIESLKRETFERVFQWGDRINLPDNRLCIYSSIEAGHDAFEAGVRMGPYGGPLPGDLVFANLPAGFEVDINFPLTAHVFIGAAALDATRRHARGITIEHAFAGRRGDLVELLRSAEAFHVLVHPEHGIATAAGGGANPVLAFTTRDCLDAVVHSMGDAARELHAGAVPFITLLENLERAECDAVMLNPIGPGVPAMIDRAAGAELLDELRKANRDACQPTDS